MPKIVRPVEAHAAPSRRKKRLVNSFFLFFSVALMLPQSAPDSATPKWLLVRPGTSEANVIYRCGIPDSVVASMRWEDFQRLRHSRGDPVQLLNEVGGGYTFEYLNVRELQILQGPLGGATSASVNIVDGKVTQVIWTYRVEAGQAAKARLLADKGYEVGVAGEGATLIGRRNFAFGRILVIVKLKNTAETEVVLHQVK
jgi:hypothetical protein